MEMKTLKSSKWFAVLMLMCLCLASANLLAQERELKTESDGFKWYRIGQNGNYGAQTTNGTTLIPLNRGYRFICYHSTYGGWFSVLKGVSSAYGACDKSGREIVAPGRYDDVYYRNKDGFEYCLVSLNGKEGACDRNGREIVAPRYESLFLSSEGVFKYKDASGEYVSTGVTPPKSGNSSYASGTTTTTTTSSSSSSSGSNGGGTGIVQERELKTEDDGFRWYECIYEKNSNGNYPKAAFDLNGKRLTPNTEYIVRYWKGFFEVWTRNDAKDNHVTAIYDKYGNCVIPDSFGFTLYCIYPEYGLILCSDSMIIKGEYIFTMDGKYYANSDDVFWTEPGAFQNASKKPASTLGGGAYASGSGTTTGRGSSSSYNNTSSSSSGSNGGGMVILPPPVMVTPTYPTTTSSSSSTQTSTPTQHRCGICGGTGRVVTNDITTYGSTATKYCSECGKTVPMYHGHIPCKNCKGKGWW